MGQVVEARARSSAAPAQVYAVLADVTCWTRWGIWTRAVVERPAPDGGTGPGAVRALTSRVLGRTIVSRERVTDAVPGELLAYELLSGLPLRDYRGRIELRPDGAGTALRWESRFTRATPGLTWFYRLLFARFLADTVARAARYAESGHAAP